MNVKLFYILLSIRMIKYIEWFIAAIVILILIMIILHWGEVIIFVTLLFYYEFCFALKLLYKPVENKGLYCFIFEDYKQTSSFWSSYLWITQFRNKFITSIINRKRGTNLWNCPFWKPARQLSQDTGDTRDPRILSALN